MSGNSNLPRPVTITEMYLSALLSELRDLRTQIDEYAQRVDELIAQQNEPIDTEPSEGVAELKEPAKPTGEPIPDDFPGAAHLRDAGITMIKDIPRSESYLRGIDGIGAVTAGKILEALG